jgi:undecaprenyl-diphosphatase
VTALIVALLPRAAAADDVRLDPLADSIAIGTGAAAAGIVALIATSGKVRASTPGDPANLLFLDRPQTEGSLAGTESLALGSDFFWYGTMGVGVLWPIVTGLEHGTREGWVDLGLYVETIAIVGGVTELVRIATLRPRPQSYIKMREGRYDPATADTGSSMSFFSGHVATVAAVGATMTYLEFLRNPGTFRPWLSLGFWTAGTATMAYLRVAARRHFVTDVLVSTIVGAVVGTLVPHLHRRHVPVQVAASVDHEGASLALQGEW